MPITYNTTSIVIHTIVNAWFCSMLRRCTKLQLLDVSFASMIDDQTVAQWIKEYPQVCFKKSFQ